MMKGRWRQRVHSKHGMRTPVLPILGFVKLLKPRRSSGKRVSLPGPPHRLGNPLRIRNLAPTLESIPHLFAVPRR